MSYLALYRKYRPTDFDSVIGQEHITTTLKNQIKTGRVGHAYLFTGTRGTGKTTVAKIFARAVNCLDPVGGSPCGKCKMCEMLSRPEAVDIIELDAASNNGVDDLRNLLDNVSFQPAVGRYKVYIIDEVHMLSINAFNALLKTLEEPPKHVIFILATTEVQKIPATILSRCMRFDFKLISTERIYENIKRIYAEIGKDAEDEAIYAIAKAGEGSMRDALSIADMCIAVTDGKLTYDKVSETVGNLSRESLFALYNSLISGDGAGVFAAVGEFVKQGKNIPIVARDIASLFRDLLYVKYTGNADGLKLPSEIKEKMEELSAAASTQYLLRGLDVLNELDGKLRSSLSQRILLETALLKLADVKNDLSVSALNRRIAMLENGKVVVPLKPVQENAESEKTELSPSVVKANMIGELRRQGERIAFAAMTHTECEVDGKKVRVMCQSADSAKVLREKSELLCGAVRRLGITEVEFAIKQKEDTSEEQKKINKAKALSGDMLEIKE